MNTAKLITLFLSMLTALQIPNMIYPAFFEDLQDVENAEILLDNAHTNVEAQRLIRQSYFSPEMQRDVLSCYNLPFEVNVVTGKVGQIPQTQAIIDSRADDNLRIKALYTALEATRIALFVAGLEAAYAQPEYIIAAPNYSSDTTRKITENINHLVSMERPDFLMPPLDQNLIDALNTIKSNIKTELSSIRTWSSWIPTGLVNLFSRNPTRIPTDYVAVTFNNLDRSYAQRNINASNWVTIRDNLLVQIIKNYDYRQKTNADDTANLLFKQCFIAQQDETAQDYWACFTGNGTITPTHYVFDAIPNIENFCHKLAKQINDQVQIIARIPSNQADELVAAQNKLTRIKNTNHQTFLNIRKAIQTAIYIANKNSTFYLGYVLPPVFTQYLDDVVGRLIMYDTKLSVLCKESRYGGTTDDLERDKIWTKITWIAAGLTVAGVAYTDYNYGFGTSLKNVYNYIPNPFSKAAPQPTTPPSKNPKLQNAAFVDNMLLEHLKPNDRGLESFAKNHPGQSYSDLSAEGKEEYDRLFYLANTGTSNLSRSGQEYVYNSMKRSLYSDEVAPNTIPRRIYPNINSSFYDPLKKSVMNNNPNTPPQNKGGEYESIMDANYGILKGVYNATNTDDVTNMAQNALNSLYNAGASIGRAALESIQSSLPKSYIPPQNPYTPPILKKP